MEPMAPKLTDDERTNIVDLCRSGLSCNEVAKQVKRAPSTVSMVAEAAGWTFGRLNVDRACEARSAYSAERRAVIAARLTEETERLLDQMREQHVAFNFGGKDNTYAEEVMAEPPVEAKRALMQTVREAMRTVLDIDKHDTKADESTAQVLLVQFVDGLREPAA